MESDETTSSQLTNLTFFRRFALVIRAASTPPPPPMSATGSYKFFIFESLQLRQVVRS